jgi:hypothetical protein
MSFRLQLDYVANASNGLEGDGIFAKLGAEPADVHIETSVEHVRLAVLQGQSDRLFRQNSSACLEQHQQQLAFPEKSA